MKSQSSLSPRNRLATLSHDTRFKVARPLLRQVARKSCPGANVMYAVAERVFVEHLANRVRNQEAPKKATICRLATNFQYAGSTCM